jgi:hypothetical protein
MHRTFNWIAVVAISSAISPLGHAQEAKKGAQAPATATHRTLTGTVSDLGAGDKTVTIEIVSEAAAKAKAKAKSSAGPKWILSVGNQTLLLRAGKNGQFSTIEFGDLQKGDTAQAVVSLQADASDRSHTAWWLVVYPAGTTPPGR